MLRKIFSKLNIFSVFILVVGVFSQCIRPEEYPDEPYLEFRRQQIVWAASSGDRDSVEKLDCTFYFQDGDGDIGLHPQDTIPPYVGEYKYNLYVGLYERKDDTTLLPVLDFEGDTLVYRNRIQYIEPVNSSGSLRGEITWTMDDFSFVKEVEKGKQVQLSFYIYDRALNKSNVIFTPPILL